MSDAFQMMQFHAENSLSNPTICQWGKFPLAPTNHTEIVNRDGVATRYEDSIYPIKSEGHREVGG
jgi:hypothetical protein